MGSNHSVHITTAISRHAAGERLVANYNMHRWFVLTSGSVALHHPGKTIRVVVWEIFSGTHRWTSGMEDEGWAYLTPVDKETDPGLDMTNMLFLEKVFTILRTGWLAHNHYGTPCTSFTFAITPPVRSPDFPEGRPGLSEKWLDTVAAGNLLVEIAARCIVVVAAADTDVTEENPDLVITGTTRRW